MSDARRYAIDASTIVEGSSHALVLDLVGDAASVLDVGCSTGGLAIALKAAGTSVVGIELDPAAADVAIAAGIETIVADVEQHAIGDLVGQRRFDCVVFADVLEHVRDPARILREALAVLMPAGTVVVSVPNITHASVRLSLLLGRFEYRSKGLLDRTHVHMFAYDELLNVAAEAGYEITRFERSTAGAFEVPAAQQVSILPDEVTEEMLALAEVGPEAQTYQFVVRLEPVDIGVVDPTDVERIVDVLRRTRAELSAVESERSRMSIEVMAMRRQADIAQERYTAALALRDRLLGLEAELREAGRRTAEVEAWYKKELVHLQHSVAWRLGRALTLPARGVRRVLRRLRGR